MSLSVFLLLMMLAVLWGSAFPMIKVGLEGLSVGHLTLARHLVASLCFAPVLLAAGRRRLPRVRDLPVFLLLGLLGITIYHLALNYGELFVSAGAASLIIATTPAFTAVLAHFLLRDRLPLLGWFGIGLAFGGVSLIAVGDGADLSLDPYALLVLLAALSTSFYFVLQKPLFGRYQAVEVSAFATWAGTIPLLVFLPGFAEALVGAGPAPVAAAVYIGIFPSALAYTVFSFALSRAPVTLVTVYLYTVPVFSLLFSWLLLGEVPRGLTLLGGTIAILGIITVNWVKRRLSRALAGAGSASVS